MDNTLLTVGLFIINLLLGVAGWTMRSMITDLKLEVARNRVDTKGKSMGLANNPWGIYEFKCMD